MSKACQKPAVLLPRALTTPVPVTTTRCMLLGSRRGGLSLNDLGDAFNQLSDVLDLFCFLVIDLDVEFALEVKEDVETIKRVDSERLEAAVRVNILDRKAFRGRDDFQNSILDGLA